MYCISIDHCSRSDIAHRNRQVVYRNNDPVTITVGSGRMARILEIYILHGVPYTEYPLDIRRL